MFGEADVDIGWYFLQPQLQQFQFGLHTFEQTGTLAFVILLHQDFDGFALTHKHALIFGAHDILPPHTN